MRSGKNAQVGTAVAADATAPIRTKPNHADKFCVSQSRINRVLGLEGLACWKFPSRNHDKLKGRAQRWTINIVAPRRPAVVANIMRTHCANISLLSKFQLGLESDAWCAKKARLASEIVLAAKTKCCNLKGENHRPTPRLNA